MAYGKTTPSMEAFREAALHCPLPGAVELIGERWAFLILRGALNGLRHFEEFQGGLGIARNILSDRLAKLVAGGILCRSPDSSDKRKVIYALTDKGESLLPVVLALRQWGEEWGHGSAEIALAAGNFRALRDPGDRIIYATAVEHDAALVTRDERLRELDPVRVVW